MSFWSWVTGADTTDNPNPGDPDGIQFDDSFTETVENRALPTLHSSPWGGWPLDWDTPNLQSTTGGIKKLIDIAWACLDLNSNVLSAMPVYKTTNGQIVDPVTWMTNPDPTAYSCWQEFAKQLFWDFQMGEAFVLPMSEGADGYPLSFRVIPPWLMNVEMNRGVREYRLGGMNVSSEVLHIRYKSSIDLPRGFGPLDVAGARMTTIGLLQRYASNLAETGGIPQYWIGVNRRFQSKTEATDLLETWIETRQKYAGHPAVLGSGATLNQAHTMSARDMTLMELSQFSESRIATLLGVPPFLVGLAGAAGSLTYSNIADLFDYHDRSSLRPKARHVMEAMSGWSLPRGSACELNRDDYTRLPVNERYSAYAVGIKAGFLGIDDVRAMERLSPLTSAQREQMLLEALIAQGVQPMQVTGPTAQPGSNGQSGQPAQTPAPIKNTGSDGNSLVAAKSLTGGAN